MPMPTNITFRPSGVWLARWKSGISSTHGPHQVAQKFTTMGWPFKADILMLRPERSLNSADQSPSIGSAVGAIRAAYIQ